MIANRIPRAELEAQAHAEYVRRLGATPTVPAPEAPDVVNAGEAASIDGAGPLWFHGRLYIVPPIPYRDGLRLHDAMMQLTAADSRESVESALEGAATLFGKLVTPASLLRFVPRKMRPNPFRDASENEIWTLLDFFWMRRTGRTLQNWASSLAARRRGRRN